MVSMGSPGTPIPTPPSLMGEEGGMASERGEGEDDEGVSSVNIMHALIKAHHWLFDNAE